MLLLYLFGTYLFTLGSCSVIAISNLPQKPFPEIIEGSSPPLHEVTQIDIIKSSLTGLFQEQHNRFMSKLESLGAACKSSNGASEGVITYNVTSSGDFRDPRINMLVKVMSKKLRDIGEIAMDDLDQKLRSFRLLLTQRFMEKFTPLISEIADLQNQVKSLANKKAFSQIGSDVTNVVVSRSEEVSTVLSSLATKLDLISKSSHVMELSEGIQQKIEALKQCENSPVIDNTLEASKKLNGDLIKIKEILKSLFQTKDDPALNVSEELLKEVLSMAKKNGKAILALSSATAEMEPALSGRLEVLNDVLEKMASDVTSSSFSPVTEAATTLEQTHELTGEVKGVINPLPCLDSNFMGSGRSLDICGAAVRFRKCYLDIVAFHCCRSCMDAGLISTVPSFSGSRNMSVLKALTLLKPT